MINDPRAIVTVGDGRGFVVANPRSHQSALIVTAAHCLPQPLEAASFLGAVGRTCWALVARHGEPPGIAVECLFADAIADLAILGEPDDQELSAEAESYGELVNEVEPLSFVRSSDHGWILLLDGRWVQCGVTTSKGSLWIESASGSIVGGMSGSPIVNDSGAAMGVVVTNQGPHPNLTADLPARMMPSSGLGMEPASN